MQNANIVFIGTGTYKEASNTLYILYDYGNQPNYFDKKIWLQKYCL